MERDDNNYQKLYDKLFKNNDFSNLDIFLSKASNKISKNNKWNECNVEQFQYLKISNLIVDYFLISRLKRSEFQLIFFALMKHQFYYNLFIKNVHQIKFFDNEFMNYYNNLNFINNGKLKYISKSVKNINLNRIDVSLKKIEKLSFVNNLNNCNILNLNLFNSCKYILNKNQFVFKINNEIWKKYFINITENYVLISTKIIQKFLSDKQINSCSILVYIMFKTFFNLKKHSNDFEKIIVLSFSFFKKILIIKNQQYRYVNFFCKNFLNKIISSINKYTELYITYTFNKLENKFFFQIKKIDEKII